MKNLNSILKRRNNALLTNVHIVKPMVFPVVMYGCVFDHKESWAPKNWCFWTVVLEKTRESLDCKEIKQVNPKGNQSWLFIGRTNAKAETPMLWPPDAKNWLIWKDPDPGKDWRQKEKGKTENEMVGLASLTRWAWVWASFRSWFWTGKLAWDSPWGWKELDRIEGLNWTDYTHTYWKFLVGVSLSSVIYLPLPLKWFSTRA